MTPRLESLPFTYEDDQVWGHLLESAEYIFERLAQLGRFRDLYSPADRRDAELMSWAQCAGRWIVYNDVCEHYRGPLRGRTAMKPHLKSAPLTLDDKVILHALLTLEHGKRLVGIVATADRRDADLLLAARQMPSVIKVRQRDNMDIAIELRGVPEGWKRCTVIEPCAFPFDM